MSIEAYTEARLRGYDTREGSPFSDEVIGIVSDVARMQASFGADYQGFLDAAGLSEPEVFIGPNGHPNEVIDVRRPEERDTLVYHLPMANPLDANQQFQLATIAAANPNTRLIAFGNASGGAHDSAYLTHNERKKVTRGDFSPLAAPVIAYLARAGQDVSHQAGYSFGADKAAEVASSRDVGVASLTVIEPVVGARGLLRLGKDFKSTEKALQGYVNDVSLAGYDTARAHGISPVDYAIGLGKLTNIAIARGLARGEFGGRLHDVLSRHPGVFTTLAWGSRSELADFDAVEELWVEHEVRKIERMVGNISPATHAAALIKFASEAKVNSMRFVGHKHAMANDVHLQAAIITQTLEAATAQ